MSDDTARLSIAEADRQLTASGGMFEIEELDIRDVPTRAWKHAPASLRVVLDMSLGHGDADFLIYEDERTTFAEHYRMAATLAQRLQTEAGVTKGDRVAIAMRNLPEWIVAFWGAAAAGAVVVPLNAWWTGDELRYGLEDSGAVVAFVDTERRDRIFPYLGGVPNLRTLVVADESRGEKAEDRVEPVGGAAPVTEWSFAAFLGQVAQDAVPPDVDIDPEDDATIFYTSGTTGRPKGAVGTQRNICTNLMSMFFINTRNSTRFGTNASMVDATGRTQSGMLLSVPLFHATGCHSILLSNTAAGGKLVMMHHFDPERALELIETERLTAFGGVPTMVMQVLDSPKFAKTDTSSIRAVSYGGAPAPPELVRRIKANFTLGQPSQGYGLTETSSVTSMNSGDDYVRKPDSVGPAVPVCDVAVVAEDFDGLEPDPDRAQGPDVIGELWIKGPNVVRGYFNRPEDTSKVFTRGWLHSGDVARIDEEGFIFIVDRAKDMIIRGGENVYSVEVEAALFEHPAVADCAVIGIPHPVLGEEVGAVIVLRPGAKVRADELADHVRERMAAFNVPTRFWFRSEPLPRNAAGKALKRALRDEVLAEEG